MRPSLGGGRGGMYSDGCDSQYTCVSTVETLTLQLDRVSRDKDVQAHDHETSRHATMACDLLLLDGGR